MRHGERGVTLVELLVATAIVAAALIPLLQMVPALLSGEQVSEVQLRLATVAVRKTEELVGRLRASITGVASGAESCTDLPGCRLEWTIATELSSAAPGVGMLRTVSVVACRDANGNASCDAGEEQVRHDTKVTSRP